MTSFAAPASFSAAVVLPLLAVRLLEAEWERRGLRCWSSSEGRRRLRVSASSDAERLSPSASCRLAVEDMRRWYRFVAAARGEAGGEGDEFAEVKMR